MKKINKLFNSPTKNSQVLEPSGNSLNAEGERVRFQVDIVLMDVEDKKDLEQP